jgi:hypothetical protein
MPEQIGAVRDLVLGSERAWTAEAVARSFHRAQVKTVEPVLDSLSAIGVLVALDGAEGRQWKGAGKGHGGSRVFTCHLAGGARGAEDQTDRTDRSDPTPLRELGSGSASPPGLSPTATS